VSESNENKKNKEQVEELTEEQQEELLKKFDAESNTRRLTGVAAGIVFALLIAFSLFQLYTGAFGQYTAYIQRTVHLGFALTLIFFLFPARKSTVRNSVPWYDMILILLSIIVCAYWPLYYETLVQHIGTISTTQMIIGGLAILLVLEAARRAVGLPITIIAAAFLLYAYFGPYMPGMFAHRGLTLAQLIDTMFFTTEGIFRNAVASFVYVYLFILAVRSFPGPNRRRKLFQ